MNERIAVIGRGIIGLTSALCLRERGFHIDVFSKDNDVANTTSMKAGAYWWPHKAYPQQRVSKWAQDSIAVYKKEAKDPSSGVSFHQHFRYCLVPDDSIYCLKMLDNWESLSPNSLDIACASAYRAQLPLIDVSKYMPYLEQRARKAGVNIITREIRDVDELFPQYQLVINCSGLGALTLVGDKELYPIRGQILRVSKPAKPLDSIRLVEAGTEFTLILPRTEDCVLGGTVEHGDWSLEVNPATSKNILDRCIRVVPELANCVVLEELVGLRPGRKEVRLELENSKHPVIHNYGHGGGGFTVAWGCAQDVLDLSLQCFRS